jgi:hypothetical protein
VGAAFVDGSEEKLPGTGALEPAEDVAAEELLPVEEAGFEEGPLPMPYMEGTPGLGWVRPCTHCRTAGETVA